MNKTITKDIFRLFLVIIFPIHTWSLYLVFYNFDWIARRTVFGDAIGYGAYSLSFALLDSLLIFLVVIPIFLLIRLSKGPDIAKAIIGTVFFVVVIWMIVYQINIINDFFIQATIENIVTTYNLRYRYKIGLVFSAAGIIALTIGLPPFLVRRSNKLESIILDFFQRLELISYLYLFFDVIAIVIVIIRNLEGIQV